MGFAGVLVQASISGYETGTREPPLPVLLKYAEVAGVWVDVLINDDLDLPDKLPCSTKHEGVKRKAVSRSKKR
jgi:transcriptional regulator with XRE-family HTH domain